MQAAPYKIKFQVQGSRFLVSGFKNALKGQRAHSPGQSAAAPWVTLCVVSYALKGQKHNHQMRVLPSISAFALTGRLIVDACEPQGVASLCPGLCALRGCPFRAFVSRTCTPLCRYRQVKTKVASSRRLVGDVRSVPAHPSLALSMYGVLHTLIFIL